VAAILVAFEQHAAWEVQEVRIRYLCTRCYTISMHCWRACTAGPPSLSRLPRLYKWSREKT